MDTVNNKRKAIQDSLSRCALRCSCAVRSESGQGIAEYVIILAVIVIACIILAVAFHGQLQALWDSITTQLGSIGSA